MKKVLLLSVCIFFLITTNGQTLRLMDEHFISMKPATLNPYDDVDGSPYLYQDWRQADLVMSGGKMYAHIPVKANVYEGKVYFQRNDSVYELYPLSSISEIRLYPNANDSSKVMVLAKGFTSNDKNVTDKLVEILARGKVSLIKTYVREIQETYDYGQSKKIRKFADIGHYYIVKDGDMQEAHFSKSALTDLTSNKASAMEDYIKQKNLNVKKPEDFAAALNYYNSL